MTRPLVLPPDTVALVHAYAGKLVNIAKDTDNIPATVSEFVAEIISGYLEFDLPTLAASAAKHHAQDLENLAAAFRSSVAELLRAANLADDLDGITPARRGGP